MARWDKRVFISSETESLILKKPNQGQKVHVSSLCSAACAAYRSQVFSGISIGSNPHHTQPVSRTDLTSLSLQYTKTRRD